MNEETVKKEKIIYTLKQITEKNRNNVYEGVGFERPEKIENLTDLDEMAFHFTSTEKIASISATGLRSTIGANSSGGLGKEATEKTFFSYGINGFMQLFNRTLSAAGQTNLSALQEKPDHSKFLTSKQRDEKEDRKLTILEAFEFTRRYMEDNRYFVFDLKQPEYENGNGDISPDNLEKINTSIDEIDTITADIHNIIDLNIENFINNVLNSDTYELSPKKRNLIEQVNAMIKNVDTEKRIYEITVEKPKTTVLGLDELAELIDKSGDIELLNAITSLRAELTMKIRETSKIKVDEIRGKAKETEGANYEVIDYNEERMEWTDIREEPHNCHTLIKKDKDGIYKRCKSDRW